MSMSTASWRGVLAVACTAVAMSACAHHTDSAARASAAPSKPLDAASLIVSLDDMRHLTGVAGLQLMSELNAGPRQGGYGQGVPVPCRALSMMDVAFGQTWKQFKGLDYGTTEGPGADVLQAVGVYADNAGARSAFDNLDEQLRQCADLHAETYKFSVNQQDPSTVALCYDQCRTLYRVKDTAVIEVAANNFPDSEKAAQTVLQTITDRIPGG